MSEMEEGGVARERTKQWTWSKHRIIMPRRDIYNNEKRIPAFSIAWRRRMDYLMYDDVYCQEDEWVSEKSYLMMLLRDEV